MGRSLLQADAVSAASHRDRHAARRCRPVEYRSVGHQPRHRPAGGGHGADLAGTPRTRRRADRCGAPGGAVRAAAAGLE
ncbi:hypothetical protein G6F65_022672 [Rhizopus arrhizus]|nr:hypothetical protein G6F65_022672 [Rhizopus arrhizus]